jgi:sugar phosphate isomerase/epimerase
MDGPMQLSVITDEISQDFEHALDVMLEYGITTAELRGLWGTNIADLSPSETARAKAALHARGMTVCALSTPLLKCSLFQQHGTEAGAMHLAQARGLPQQPELLRRCASIAHTFGTKNLRIFSFWADCELSSDIEARIVEQMHALLPIAQEQDVMLLLENEHACFLGTGAETARVLKAVSSPRLQACWDPGNALHAGEVPYPDGYEAVAPWLKHIHIKDAARDMQGTLQWCVIGEGEIDYAGQFSRLKQDRYTGCISLETHYIPDGGTPEAGSRACMAALATLVKDG